MPATQSVITLERFAKGKSFQQYLDSGIRNKELFENNYNGLKVSEAQTKALKDLVALPNGPRRVVVIGEDWCPDVYRGTGVAQKIAEAAGIEFRFFERDQNKDMIAEYLKDGEFESIPVFVFYDKDQNEIAHFIERPKLANEQIHVTRDVIGDMSPAAITAWLGHEPSEEELAAERAKGRDRYMQWQRESAEWANWRVATVDDVIESLKAKLS